MDEYTMLQLVIFTMAIVEGLKQTLESFSDATFLAGFKIVTSVIVGGVLAGVAEFAPDVWLRIVPILTVGLAAAGLYSITKRTGGAVKEGLMRGSR